ncbi:MAG: T9SS type A sorting domain-containing protein, partial [Saprospiraceae bacterium]|nr:T9SS type A sorting domain-containing protein [Saprospiraceae bacterium]
PVPGTNEGDITYAGSYYLTVTNGGCTDIASVTVIEDKTEPNVTLSGDEKLTCANDYTVTLTVNIGSFAPSELAFAWTNATPVAGKPYQATVSSQSQINVSVDVQNKANGCIKRLFRSVELGNNIVQVPQIVNKDNDNLHCENTEVELEVQPQNYGSYEWQDDEGNILGEEKFLTVTKPGQYKVIVTDAQNGCMASATIFVSYSSCSNLEILNGKSQANNSLIWSVDTQNEKRRDQITKKISVWPNPTTSSTFRLDLADFHNHNLLVHIFDINGTLIYSNEFTDVGEEPYAISVQNIRGGQYSLRAIIDGKSYVMTRFIVQND